MTNDAEKIKRGMPRSLIYVLIPLGFVLLAAVMMLGGIFDAEEPADATPADANVEVIQNPQPADQGASGTTDGSAPATNN